jgi:SMI1-KNR4 cell-wall
LTPGALARIGQKGAIHGSHDPAHPGGARDSTMLIYGDFDVSDFWLDTDGARKRYVGEPLTDALLASIEEELGYRIPRSYVELMRVQNGGVLARTMCRTPERHIEVEGIYGINRSKRNSLGGIWTERRAFTGRNPGTGEPIVVEAKTIQTGSRFWISEWGYPPIGVYFAECASGHEMIGPDYWACGPQGEPRVVHVHQEGDYDITDMAANFEMFVRGLRRSE